MAQTAVKCENMPDKIDVNPSNGEGRGGDVRTLLNVKRSVNGRCWVNRLDSDDDRLSRAIMQRVDISDIVARVLAARGVLAEDVEAFLTPSLRELMPDPSNMTDMDVAAAKIAEAIISGTSIALFGDYDVDGATSSALMARYLAHFDIPYHIHIPDRVFEGYGPNVTAIDALYKAGARLLITLDCGTTSHDVLAHARAIGFQTIVLDHHQTGVDLPEALAVVNPNRQDDLSGLGYLAAVGVIFLTLVAVNRCLRELRERGEAKFKSEPDLRLLLDLVALGTVADVVPLIGLNRVFVIRGLEISRQRLNVGLSALADISRLNGPMTAYHLGFVLGPRINAGGRIGQANLGIQLLTESDSLKARHIAQTLDRLNKERQILEKETLEEAEALLIAGKQLEADSVLVVSGHNWHPGVVGLIAARLKERYRRPCLAIAFDEMNIGTGSARSIPGIDLGAVVRGAVDEGLLIKGGGHAMAAGLTVQADKIQLVKEYLSSSLDTVIARVKNDDALKIDGALTVDGASIHLVNMLQQAGPFGAGNPEPIFVFPAHRVLYAEEVQGGHIRCSVAGSAGKRIQAIAFRAVGVPLGKTLMSARRQNKSLHLAGTLSLNHWGGAVKVQLRILDAAEIGPLSTRH